MHLVEQRVGHVLDVPTGADEHGAAPVAGGAQQHAGDQLIEPAGRADQADREDQRAVEDVVARVRLAVDEREQERDDRHLEQRRDDPGEPRPLCARRVEPGAREQEDGDQGRERHVVPCGVERRLPGPVAVLQHGLHHQRDRQGAEDPGEVEREQRDHAYGATQRLHPQEEGEHRRALAPHVDSRQRHGRRRVRSCAGRGAVSGSELRAKCASRLSNAAGRRK